MFLPKPFDDRDLLDAVREGVGRHARALRADAEVADLRARAAALTGREREVMELVVAGMPNKQAAAALGVREKTVKAHVSAILGKLNVSNPWRAMLLEYRTGAPPATELGEAEAAGDAAKRAQKSRVHDIAPFEEAVKAALAQAK